MPFCLHTAITSALLIMLAACTGPYEVTKSIEIYRINTESLKLGDLRHNLQIRHGDTLWYCKTPRFEDVARNPETITDRVRPDGVEEYPPYRIKPGDVLLVSIYELRKPGQDDQQHRRVSPNGSLRLYVVGPLQAEGRTPQELEHDISSQLEKAGKLSNATVAVQVLDGKMFFVVKGIEADDSPKDEPKQYKFPDVSYTIISAFKQYDELLYWSERYPYVYLERMTE